MAASATSGHHQNRLLAAIPQDVYTLLAPDLKETVIKQGEILQEGGDTVDRVYFPQSGMISLLVVTKDGGAIEAATIGREGAAGLQRGLGKRKAFTRAVIQVGGRFSHMPAERFEKAASKSEAIRNIIANYMEVLWMEAQQIAACNAIHSAEQRLGRWLLQTRDRIESDTLPLTQEFLSQMLGVRRTTVTLVAQTLQAAGLINYHRGKIAIVDGEGLLKATCECYAATHHKTLPNKIGVKLGGA